MEAVPLVQVIYQETCHDNNVNVREETFESRDVHFLCLIPEQTYSVNSCKDPILQQTSPTGHSVYGATPALVGVLTTCGVDPGSNVRQGWESPIY